MPTARTTIRQTLAAIRENRLTGGSVFVVRSPGGAADRSQGWSERSERNPWNARTHPLVRSPGGATGRALDVHRSPLRGYDTSPIALPQGLRCAPPLATIGRPSGAAGAKRSTPGAARTTPPTLETVPSSRHVIKVLLAGPAGDGEHGPEDGRVDGVLQEPNRAVGHRRVRPARVASTERPAGAEKRLGRHVEPAKRARSALQPGSEVLQGLDDLGR